ncbi:MAG: hypothetical protein KME07_07495 [Pegethrix bostrychoides GSE-TBD4-15B]|uniref:Uncharacterized protein n=1 Tax=Pegethrix bostrychoides GSE-TBD4-15B TaxID=2839662 RepID=A0A951U4C8_9CYAN|nr:hypothetical protein [Pegethrix bostrychoides GSE-TBD4-15B]
MPTSVQSRLLAGSLLVLSTCGTLALFGAVPMIERRLSAFTPSNSPRQAQSDQLNQSDQLARPDQPEQPNWKLSKQPPLHLRPRS